MKTKELFAEANEAFYKWEEENNFTDLSEDDLDYDTEGVKDER